MNIQTSAPKKETKPKKGLPSLAPYLSQDNSPAPVKPDFNSLQIPAIFSPAQQTVQPLDPSQVSRPNEPLVGNVPNGRFTPGSDIDPLVATMQVYDLKHYGQVTGGQVNDPDRAKFRDAADSLIRGGGAAGQATSIYYQVAQNLGLHESDPQNPSRTDRTIQTEPFSLERAMYDWDMVKYGKPTYGYVNDPERQKVRDQLSKLITPSFVGSSERSIDQNEQLRILGRAPGQPGEYQQGEVPQNLLKDLLFKAAGDDPAAHHRLQRLGESGMISPTMSPAEALSQTGKTYDPLMSPDTNPGAMGQTLQNMLHGGMAGLYGQEGLTPAEVNKEFRDWSAGSGPNGATGMFINEMLPMAPYMVPGVGHRLFALDVASAFVGAKDAKDLGERARSMVPVDQLKEVFDTSQPAAKRAGAAVGFGLFAFGVYKGIADKIGDPVPDSPMGMSVKQIEVVLKTAYPDLNPSDRLAWAEKTHKANKQGLDPKKGANLDGFQAVIGNGNLGSLLKSRRAAAQDTAQPGAAGPNVPSGGPETPPMAGTPEPVATTPAPTQPAPAGPGFELGQAVKFTTPHEPGKVLDGLIQGISRDQAMVVDGDGKVHMVPREALTPHDGQDPSKETAPAETPLHAAHVEPNPTVIGEAPFHSATLSPYDIKVDPQIQYKTVEDKKTGTGARLKGIDTFDLGQAGELSVWERHDGQYYVVHGHHRLELAQRAGKFGYFGPGGEFIQVPKALRVRVMRESEGWTLPDVRVHAAMENIRNGDGTALDAVAALRESGVKSQDYNQIAGILADKGIALKGSLARDTAGLLSASDELLHNVKIGQVEVPVASGVASVEGLPREQQVHAALAAEKAGIRHYDDARRFGLNYKDSLEWGNASQESLFGDEPVQQSTLGQQYAIEQSARRQVKQEISKMKGSLQFEPINANEFVDKDARREFVNAVTAEGDVQWRIDKMLEKFGDVKDLRRQLAGEVARGEKTHEAATRELATKIVDTLKTARQREYVEGRPGAQESPQGVPNDGAGAQAEHVPTDAETGQLGLLDEPAVPAAVDAKESHENGEATAPKPENKPAAAPGGDRAPTGRFAADFESMAKVQAQAEAAKAAKVAKAEAPKPESKPVAKEPWQMTREEYESTPHSRSYDDMLRAEHYAGNVSYEDLQNKSRQDLMGQKQVWAKTRAEIEDEIKQNIKSIRADRAAVNKLDVVPGRPKWSIKSQSNTLRLELERAQGEAERALGNGKANSPWEKGWHHDRVEEALKDGKPVPPEVLADYPELAKKYAQTEAKPEAKAPEQKAEPKAEPKQETKPKTEESAPADAKESHEEGTVPDYGPETAKARFGDKLSKGEIVFDGDRPYVISDIYDPKDGKPPAVTIRRIQKDGTLHSHEEHRLGDALERTGYEHGDLPVSDSSARKAEIDALSAKALAAEQKGDKATAEKIDAQIIKKTAEWQNEETTHRQLVEGMLDDLRSKRTLHQEESAPAPKPESKPAAVKEPWQMTQADVAAARAAHEGDTFPLYGKDVTVYQNRRTMGQSGPVDFVQGANGRKYFPDEWQFYHGKDVEKAIKDGKPVPPEVLADYPDLAKKYAQAEAKPEAKVPEEYKPGTKMAGGKVADARLVKGGDMPVYEVDVRLGPDDTRTLRGTPPQIEHEAARLKMRVEAGVEHYVDDMGTLKNGEAVVITLPDGRAVEAVAGRGGSGSRQFDVTGGDLKPGETIAVDSIKLYGSVIGGIDGMRVVKDGIGIERAADIERQMGGKPKQEPKPEPKVVEPELKMKKVRPKSFKEWDTFNDDFIAKYEAKRNKGVKQGEKRGATSFTAEDFEYVARKAIQIVLKSGAKATITVTEAAKTIAKEIGIPDNLFHEVADRIQELKSHVSETSLMKRDRVAKEYGNKRPASDAFAIDEELLSAARKEAARQRRESKRAALADELAQGRRPLADRLWDEWHRNFRVEPSEESHTKDFRTRMEKAAAWLQANPGKDGESAPKGIKDIVLWAEAARERKAQLEKAGFSESTSGAKPANADLWAPSLEERQAAARVNIIERTKQTLDAIANGELHGTVEAGALSKTLGIDAGKGGIKDIPTQLDFAKSQLERIKKALAEDRDPFQDPQTAQDLLDKAIERVAQLEELKRSTERDPGYVAKVMSELQAKADADLLAHTQETLRAAESGELLIDDIKHRVSQAMANFEDIPANRIDELPADGHSSKAIVEEMLAYRGYVRDGDHYTYKPDTESLLERSTAPGNMRARMPIKGEPGGPRNVFEVGADFERDLNKALKAVGRGGSPGVYGTSLKGSRGVYMTRQQTRFTRSGINLRTTAHEAFHMLHDMFLGTVPKEVDAELQAGPFRASEHGAKDKAGRQKERVAELGASYLGDPVGVRQIAPEAVEWMLSSLPKEVRDVMEGLGREMRRFEGGTNLERASAFVYTTPIEESFAQRAADFMGRAMDFNKQTGPDGLFRTKGADVFRALFTDKIAPFESAVKELYKRNNIEQGVSRDPALPAGLLPRNNPIIWATEIPYLSYRVADAIQHGLTSADGLHTSPSIRSLMRSLEATTPEQFNARTKEAASYAAALRQLEVYKNWSEWAKREASKRQAVEAQKFQDKHGEMVENAVARRNAAIKLANQAITKQRAREMRRATTAAEKRRVARWADKARSDMRKEANVKMREFITKETERMSRQFTAKAERIAGATERMAARKGGDLLPNNISESKAPHEKLADAQKVVDEVRADPEKYRLYEGWRNRYQAIEADMLDYMVDHHLVSHEQAALLRERGFDYYALNRSQRSVSGENNRDPLFDWVRGDSDYYQSQGGAMGAAERAVKKLKGSQKELNDPYENLMAKMNRVIHQAHTNMATRTFARLADTNRSFHGPDADTGDIAMYLPDTPPGPDAHPFSNGALAPRPYEGEGGGMVFSFFSNGVKRQILVRDKALATAMKDATGNSHNWIDSMVIRALGAPGRLLRAGTVYAPPFAVRNFLRDSGTRSVLDVYSDRSLNAKNFFDSSARGRALNDIASARKDYDRLGLSLGQMDVFRDGRKWEKVSRLLRSEEMFDTYKGKKKEHLGAVAGTVVKHGAMAYQHGLEAAERSNREIVYGNAKRFSEDKLGWQGEDAKRAAAFASRRTMTDFKRSGLITQYINSIVPFVNPRVQGLAQAATTLARSGYARRKWVLFSLAAFAAEKMWEQLSNTQDRKDELPQYKRDLFMNFFPSDGGPALSIPKSHELGLFHTALDRLWDAHNDPGSPYSFGDFMGTAANVLLPMDEAQLTGPFQTGAELVSNYSFFRKREIVSGYEKDLSLDQRKGAAHASPLGKAAYNLFAPVVEPNDLLKRMLDDPRKWDHLFENAAGNTGGLLTEASRLTDGSRRPTDFVGKLSGVVASPQITTAGQTQWMNERLHEAGVTTNPLKALNDAFYATDDDNVRGRLLKAAVEITKEARVDIETAKENFDPGRQPFSDYVDKKLNDRKPYYDELKRIANRVRTKATQAAAGAR